MNIITRNETNNKSGGRRVVDWEPLRVIPPGEPGLPRGFCESCALYIWVEGGYKIPGVRGLFCSVLCFECSLFGLGKCRWCGEKLEGAGKFCGDACRKKSEPAKFGDGARLLNFLSYARPGIYRRLTGENGTVCLGCRATLTDKRKDANFCSMQCKSSYHRQQGVAKVEQ